MTPKRKDEKKRLIRRLPPWDDSTKRMLERDNKVRDNDQDFKLPAKVADALNIFCHEKIHKWKSSSWCWAEDIEYNAEV